MNVSASATSGRGLRPERRPIETVRAIAGAVLHRARRARDRWAEQRRLDRTIVELQALSDEVLKDIGIDRSEIEYVALQCRSVRRPDC